MNGVEAAASLFGSEESSSDPFAALTADNVTPSHFSEDLFYDESSSTSSSFLEPTTQAPYNSGDNAEGILSAYTQHEPVEVSYSPESYTPAAGIKEVSQQEEYGKQGEWNYDHAPTFTSNNGHALHFQANNDSNTHDPYAPYLAPPNPAYASYTLTTSAPTPNSYILTAAKSVQPPQAHTPYTYTPPTEMVGSNYTSSYLPATQPTYTPLHVNPPPPAIPSAPPPVTTVSRPKVSNAYDPPFPTMSSRRAPRLGSGQQSSYNTYQPVSLPPLTSYTAAPQNHIPPPPPRSREHLNQDYEQPYIDQNTTEFTASSVDTSLYSQGGAFRTDSQSGSRPSTSTFEEHEYAANSNTTMLATAPGCGEEVGIQQNAFLSNHFTEEGANLRSRSPSSTAPTSRYHTSSPVVHSPLSQEAALLAYSGDHGSSSSPPLASSQDLDNLLSNRNLGPETQTLTRDTSPKSTTGPLHKGTSEIRSTAQSFNTVLRTSSPAPTSQTTITRTQSPHAGPAVYLPKSSAGSGRISSPINPLNAQVNAGFDPYAPKALSSGYNGERISSPNSFPVKPKHSPNNPSLPVDLLRNRSMSNSSLTSSASASQEDPYAPSQRMRRQTSEAEYGNNSSRYSYSQEVRSPPQPPQPGPAQEVLAKPFHTPYAPSPSLLGANDPLGRTAARIPVFSFGFGGKFVTCFHGAASMNTGFDVALSSRNSTGVHVRVLQTLISESALNSSTASFPGPLFSDPGTSMTSLVRAGASTQTKTKKAQVVKYLSERAEEIALGLPYLKSGSTEGYREEGKLALIKVLKVMVENDGRLTGTQELDHAIRIALIPRLGQSVDAKQSLPPIGSPDLGVIPYPASIPSTQHYEHPISVTTLRPSVLDTIQNLLMRGERRQAYHFALDEKLWAHAMIIASSIDKEAWKEVVNEFLKNELGAVAGRTGDNLLVKGREGLRVAYSLFSGQGANAVQELIPQHNLAKPNARLQPALPHMTPRTPNFGGPPSLPASISMESISQWAETVAMMISSPLSPETSAALTSLGDQLVANEMFEAAHICYLLAPQTSPLGGLGNPAARIVLVGSRNPQNCPNFVKDSDPLIFSEIVEFALSLTPTPRGQDTYQGIPHLQAYRFIRTMGLAEIGDISTANRYCEAITTSMNRSSPYFTPVLLDQLRGLSERIGGVAHVDKSGSWMGAKLSKPSLDTIGGWLEGRFTKLVTGDVDSSIKPEDEVAKPDERGFAGPFAHYSTISSATPSARSSPQPSLVNMNTLPVPPPRSGSAMAASSPYAHPQIDRASSAMDYVRRKPSPGPRIVSASAATTSFAKSTSFGQAVIGHQSINGYTPSEEMITPRASINTDEDETPVQEAGWWSSSMYGESPTTQTPTASTFLRVDENVLTPSSDGFVSLMDNDTYSIASKSPSRSTPEVLTYPTEDEEDLGFGNSRVNRSTKESMDNRPSPVNEAPKEPIQQQTAPPSAPTGSWISRWWRGSDPATPGPVKASLGEESSFYYDAEQKRWVNKKANGNETLKPSAPPPPPTRAQTVSPGMTGPRPPGAQDSGPSSGRSASAIDLSTSPPSRTVMRVRSNLVPLPESAPSTPTGTRLAPSGPPPGRPKSQASKRNIRNRYVDVFQQEGGA